MKYRIEIKPVRTFKPLFAADSIDEIKAWLANPANTSWRYYGTGAGYKKIQSKSRRDLAVTEMVRRGDMMDGNDNVPMAYTETVALQALTTCESGSDIYAALK